MLLVIHDILFLLISFITLVTILPSLLAGCSPSLPCLAYTLPFPGRGWLTQLAWLAGRGHRSRGQATNSRGHTSMHVRKATSGHGHTPTPPSADPAWFSGATGWPAGGAAASPPCAAGWRTAAMPRAPGAAVAKAPGAATTRAPCVCV